MDCQSPVSSLPLDARTECLSSSRATAIRRPAICHSTVPGPMPQAKGDFSGTIPARVISSSPIYRRRREEKPTRCGRLRTTPRRATSAHSTPTRTDKAVCTSNQLPAQRPLKPLPSRWKTKAQLPPLPDRLYWYQNNPKNPRATAGHPYTGAACCAPTFFVFFAFFVAVFLSFSESFSGVECRLRRKPHRRSEIPVSRRNRSPALARANRWFARPASLPSQSPAEAIVSPRLYHDNF